MKNIENAVMIKRTPEPRNAALSDILIHTLVTDMMDTSWGILEGKYSAAGDMVKMRQTYTDKCREYSRILYLAGGTDDQNWAIRPVFASDSPIADVPDPDDFPVIFPVGVTFNGTVYSYDIEAYFSALHRDYIPSVERMYAEKLSFVRQHKGDDFPIILS
ncbi:MAG: hypothetical protein IJH79_20790 [Lentisphaeria bacterium]|nr:hypothetical protein [Lentisphaeria bacterium]